MRYVILAAVLALAASNGLAASNKPVPWRTATPADSLAKPNVVSETWDLRAVSPDGTRGIVVRFWTKGNPWYIEWVWYTRGRGVPGTTVPVKPALHTGPGVSMKEPHGSGSIRRVGQRWLLDASGGSLNKSRTQLVLRSTRPGITMGPLPASGRRAAWLSVVATGLVDGVVVTPDGTMRLRGWYGAHVHEWATYEHYETSAFVRRDLALLWRSPTDVRVVWGLEPFLTQNQRLTPDDSSWRGISARLGARHSACAATVRRGGLKQGALTYAQPTTTLTARCGSGAALALRHPDGKIGGSSWVFGQTFTGLATSNVGGVGFLEQTIPDA